MSPRKFPRAVSQPGQSDAERLVSIEHRIDDLESGNKRLRALVIWLVGLLAAVVLAVVGFAYTGYAAYANRLIDLNNVRLEGEKTQAERWGRVEAQLAEIQRRLDRAP